EVRLEHRAPIVVGHPRQQAVAGDARVVDKDVEVTCLLDEPCGFLRTRDVGLDRAALARARQCPRPFGSAAVADDARGPGARELRCDRASDPLGGAGDEGAFPLQRGEAHGLSASSSGSCSSASMLFTETALTLRSIRLTRPVSTLPGPTSTKVRTPSR